MFKRSSCALVLLGLFAQLFGCGAINRVVNPEQARLEEAAAQRKAAAAQIPDGECAQAEECKQRCEIFERALDCYKTGKAALRGVDVHYKGGWRVEKVAGSTDDVRVRHEAASEEHMSLMPLARESFERACAANHAESCRLLAQMVESSRPQEAAVLYRKACTLHDAPACETISRAHP